MITTFGQLKELITQLGEHYAILPIGADEKLLIWEEAGRAFGPYTAEDSVGLYWTDGALANAETCRAFRRSGGWNVGGDRLWVAPEFPFFTKRRSEFNATYTVQRTLDPGETKLTAVTENEIVLESDMEAELYEHRYSAKKLRAARRFTPCENPLRFAAGRDRWMQGVSFSGFCEDIRMEDLSPEAPMALELWELCQVRAGGVFLIPYYGERFDYVDYYAPSAGQVLSLHDGCACIRVRSCAEHKIGARSYQSTGRVGYLLPEGGGQYTLLIRNYWNNPSDRYLKEPSDRRGENGCSLFVYMNDTRGDGFAELETTGETFGENGEDASRLALYHWFFRGSLDALQPILQALLGIRWKEDIL